MPGPPTAPGRPGTRVIAPGRVAFRQRNSVGTREERTFAARWLAYAIPSDASPIPSRASTHGSGPMWVATPSSQWTSTTYSLPVSRRSPLYAMCGRLSLGKGFLRWGASAWSVRPCVRPVDAAH
jgi:hypothetical protein